jgi:hypothetical protein
MMRATAFFDSFIIATARTSCLTKPDELRALKDNGPVATAKLPICEGILTDLRARSWPEGWSDEAKRLKAVFVPNRRVHSLRSRQSGPLRQGRRLHLRDGDPGGDKECLGEWPCRATID